MKKALWFLCIVVGIVVYAQEIPQQRINELTSDLKEEIDPGQDATLTASDLIEEETEILPDQAVAAPMPDVVPEQQIESDEILEIRPIPQEGPQVVEDDAIVQGFLKDDTRPPQEGQDLIIPDDKLMFDINKKRDAVINLVTRAMRELESQPLDIACNRFSHTKEFIQGDLYVFLYDIDGTCLAHGDDAQLIWQNLINLTDSVGTPVVRQIIKKAQAGGGWVTYGWHNSTKVSYVQLVQKEGKSYIVGSGYFPHSKEEAVVNLVKGGVALFNQVKKSNQPVYWAFSRMNYPSGPFVNGNLYLYALDFQGNIVAQGDRPGLINTNAWNYQDERGLLVNQEIIKKLEKTAEGEGVWVEYISKRALKKAYAEKVVDRKGTRYFIACGYYPDANRQATIDLVRKGYQFMKTSGKSSAVAEFSQRRTDEYRYGDLYLVVYDLDGKIIADGGNADNIGRTMWKSVDQDNIPYIQRMIKRATKEGVWINAKIQGSFQSTFAQKIDLGISQFVISCSYYPVSKPETMMLLVQSGASYLQANPREEAFAQFVKPDGRFRRGDLQLMVVDTEGLCYAYGDDFDLIWRNIFDIKDEAGRPFIKMFINEVQRGPVVIKTKLNNAIKTNYVASVQKAGKMYVISSGYYQ